MRNRELARARANQEQAARLAAAARQRAGLVTDGAVRLSDHPRLAVDTYHDLMDLVSAALAVPTQADGSRRCVSSDGQLEVVVWPPQPLATATLVTDDGTLTLPDFQVSIRPCDSSQVALAAAEAV